MLFKLSKQEASLTPKTCFSPQEPQLYDVQLAFTCGADVGVPDCPDPAGEVNASKVSAGGIGRNRERGLRAKLGASLHGGV